MFGPMIPKLGSDKVEGWKNPGFSLAKIMVIVTEMMTIWPYGCAILTIQPVDNQDYNI